MAGHELRCAKLAPVGVERMYLKLLHIFIDVSHYFFLLAALVRLLNLI